MHFVLLDLRHLSSTFLSFLDYPFHSTSPRKVCFRWLAFSSPLKKLEKTMTTLRHRFLLLGPEGVWLSCIRAYFRFILVLFGLVAGTQQVFLIYIERSQMLDSRFSGFTHIHSPFPLYFSFSLLLHIPVSSLLPTNSPTRTHTHRFKDFLFIKRPAKSQSQSQSQIQSQPFGVAVTAKTKKRFPWPPASSSSFSFSFSSSPSPSFRSSSLCLVQGDKMVFLHGVGEIVNHDIISKEDVMSKHPTRLGRARLWLAQVVYKNRSQPVLDLPKKRENFSWRLLAFWFVFLLGPWSRDP